MKKRTLSLLMCLLLIVGVMPTTAFAAGGTTDTWAVKLNVSESDAYTYNGQKVLALGFGVQSDNLPVRKAASMVLAVDLEMFDLLKDNDDFSGVENAAGDLTVSLVQASTPIKKGVTIKPSESWNLNVYYAKSADEKFGYIQMIASQDAVDDKVVTAKDLATMYIGFKSGKSVSDLTKNSIRFINAAECALLNQGSAIEITNGKGNMQQAFLKDGSAGTLTITPEVAWNGITPPEPAKPAYTGDIAAPTVNSNAGGKVVLNAAELTPADTAAKIQYGYSNSASTAPTTWQDSTTFDSLTVGSTYYFYAKVVGTMEYTEKVSAATSVTVLDKELTNLEITTQPSTKTYTHGDTFKTDGMKVKSTYNDGTFDADFKDYTVAYETSGKNYLCKDNTKVTLNAGGKSVEVTSLTVNAKELTVTGLTAVNREYDTTVNVALTGGTLSGKVGSDEVDASIPTSGTMTDAKVGNNKPVTVATPSLTGAAAGNYTLKPISGITVNIAQATPDVGDVSYAGTGTIYTSTALSAISLSMDGTAVGTGTLALDAGQTLTVGTNNYNWTFTPSDTTNYKTVTGKVSLTVKEDALVSIAVKTGTAPTKVSYKYKEPFEITGAVIEATYASTATKDVTAEVEFSTTLAVGQTSVTVTYQGKTCDITGITVNKATATGTFEANFDVLFSDTTAQAVAVNDFTGLPNDIENAKFKGSVGTKTDTNSIIDSYANDSFQLNSGLTTASNGHTASWTVTIESDNYDDITAKVNVKVINKADANVTITGAPTDKTYGDADFTLTASAANMGTGTGAWTWNSSDPSVLSVTDTGNTATVKILKAGSATISAKFESDTTVDTETTAAITVGKATITVAAKNQKIYVNGTAPDLSAPVENTHYTVTGLVGSDTLGGTITMEYRTSGTAATPDVTKAGTYDIAISGATEPVGGNYNTIVFKPATLTISKKSSGGGSSSYAITVDKTENGTITVSPKSASKGDTVTITVKPDKGYELDTLKVLDKNGDKVKLTEKNGKYTFTMPTGKVTVKGSFVEEAPVQIFKDVPVDAYYYEAVKWAAEKGITGGVGNDLFAPNQPCTRAQIVTFLWRAAGSPAPKNMSSFADVPADAFYAKAVAWAVENGITGGTGDGKFSPDATCTRAQAVTFLYRASGAPAVSGNAAFSDVATNAYYAAAVKWAEKNGITGGIGGGLFGSDNNCTRAQIVTFLYRGVK